jgi:hypothetical protein
VEDRPADPPAGVHCVLLLLSRSHQPQQCPPTTHCTMMIREGEGEGGRGREKEHREREMETERERERGVSVSLLIHS